MDIKGALISVLLAGGFYIVILICYRLMGKREISQLSIFDFVVNLIVADVVATGIVEEEYWLDSLGGFLMLVLLQIIMAKVQLKFPKTRSIVDGEPSLIIKHGRIDYSELRNLNIELDEVMMMLRQKKIASIEDIQYAVLEPNGKISIFEKKLPTKVFPLPLIISGQIKIEALKSLGKDKDWLLKELEKHQMTQLHQFKYVYYEENKLILYTKNEMHKLKLQTS